MVNRRNQQQHDDLVEMALAKGLKAVDLSHLFAEY
jgi:hypothetical protein